LAISGLGRFTEKGSALLIMGIAGGAIIPKLFASLKETYNFQVVFFALMVPCYIYILYYAIKGYTAGKATSKLAVDMPNVTRPTMDVV
jgi:MFS transporter, FHS family, L-fucose permease